MKKTQKIIEKQSKLGMSKIELNTLSPLWLRILNMEEIWIIHYVNYDDKGYSGIQALAYEEFRAFELFSETIFWKYQEELSTGELSRSDFDNIVNNAWRKGEWDNGDWARYTVRKYKLSDYSELDKEYLEAMKD